MLHSTPDRPQPRRRRGNPGLAKGGAADVGRVAQDAPDGFSIPSGFAGPGELAKLLQAAADRVDAELADPAENLAHDGRLLLANLIARRTPTA